MQCIRYDIHICLLHKFCINQSINQTNKVLFNGKIMSYDLIEVMLNNSYRIKRSSLKALDKSFYICMYMYYISMTYVLHVYVYYINFVSINQTNKVSYKSIKNKRLKEISNQIVIKDMKESHRKLFLYNFLPIILH